MNIKHTRRRPSKQGTGKLANHSASLRHAKFVRPDRLELEFSDGFSGTWSFRQLDLDMKAMDLATVKASRSGKFVALKSKSGDRVQLDASWLRALVDSAYAAEMERWLDKLANR